MKSVTKFAVFINWTIPFVAQTSAGKKDDGAYLSSFKYINILELLSLHFYLY